MAKLKQMWVEVRFYCALYAEDVAEVGWLMGWVLWGVSLASGVGGQVVAVVAPSLLWCLYRLRRLW